MKASSACDAPLTARQRLILEATDEFVQDWTTWRQLESRAFGLTPSSPPNIRKLKGRRRRRSGLAYTKRVGEAIAEHMSDGKLHSLDELARVVHAHAATVEAALEFSRAEGSAREIPRANAKGRWFRQEPVTGPHEPHLSLLKAHLRRMMQRRYIALDPEMLQDIVETLDCLESLECS